MSRAEVNPDTITLEGVDQNSTTGVGDGHMFANTGQEWIEVENTHATLAREVSVLTNFQILGLDLTDAVVSIPAQATRRIGPFQTQYFNQADGKVYVNYESGAEGDLELKVFTI